MPNTFSQDCSTNDGPNFAIRDFIRVTIPLSFVGLAFSHFIRIARQNRIATTTPINSQAYVSGNSQYL